MNKLDNFIDLNSGLRESEKELLNKFYKHITSVDYFKTPKEIAFIHEENNHLAGGRYYSWFIISALLELGHKVTVYTNRKAIFMSDFKNYKRPRLVIASMSAYRLSSINIKADLYIGSPVQGALAATRLGRKYNKPSFALVFDPFPMMEKYLGKKMFSGWDELIKELKNNDTKIIALCEETKKYIINWLGKKEVFVVYPCINSREIEIVENPNREDYVVFISRLVKNKRFEDVLNAVSKTNLKLKVISSVSGINHMEMVKNTGMKDRVTFYWKISDREKFEIISKSRAVINGAIFEGFGMYLAEAIATGTPAVLYDYPTFREIRDYAGVDNVYLAKMKDVRDLTRKLKQAIKEEKYREPSNKFNFDVMVESLYEI